MVYKPVDCSERHCGIWKGRVPCPEWLVCGDQGWAALISCADQFEQHAGSGLILCDAGDVIEDQQIELVGFGDGTLQREVASRLLELLDQTGRAGEQNTP